MNTAPIVMILTEVITTVSVIHDYINIHKKEKERTNERTNFLLTRVKE